MTQHIIWYANQPYVCGPGLDGDIYDTQEWAQEMLWMTARDGVGCVVLPYIECTDSLKTEPLKLTIVGFIWTGDDSFDVTVRTEGQSDFTRVHIPAFVQHVRKVAAERGVSMGDLCDEMNRELEAKERAERQRQGIPSFEMTFTAPISPELWQTLNWKRVE